MLTELRPTGTDASGEDKKLNVVTDEIEEKDVAIQMLSVFIDELGVAFAEFVEPASRVCLSLTSYEANSSIRSTCASALPGLIKCAKLAGGITPQLSTMAKEFNANLVAAMKEEVESECLITQVQSLKDILDQMGEGFLN